MFRLLQEWSRGVLSIKQYKLTKWLQDFNGLAMTIHTGHVWKESENSEPTSFEIPMNKNGERMVFDGHIQPPGYAFVPSGKPYITRNCRKFTRESGRSVYVVYRHQSRRRPATKIGLYVPNDIFEQVKSDFETIKIRHGEDLWQRLHKEYPKMPHVDKTKVHHICSSAHSKLVGKFLPYCLSSTVWGHIRDGNNSFKSLNTEARRRVERTIAFWRGEK